MTKLMAALLALTMTVAVSCSSGGGGDENESPSQPPASTNEIDVGLQEYAFNISGEAQPGPLTINYQNTGKELHMGIVARLDQGKTLEDVQAAVQKQKTPSWFHDQPAEDLSLLSPGESVSETINASTPGTYVMLCFITAPSGKPHVALGMFNTFEVTGSKLTTEPQADATFSIAPDGIDAPDLSAGSSTVEISNGSDTTGDFNVVQLAPGKTKEDVDAWFQNNLEGPAPASFLGGTHGIKPGDSFTMTLDLTPGTYTAVSTFKGKDVIQEFTVT